METVIKIQNYKGKVIGNWKVPCNKRQYRFALKKLLKLYYRCKKTNLLTKELLFGIKHYTEQLLSLGEITMWIFAEPQLIPLVEEVLNTTPEEFTEEVVLEKVRQYQTARCPFCNTELKYPAIVVYRKGNKVEKMSAPVGIKCLNRIVGKLNDLTQQIKIVISQLGNTPKSNEKKVKLPENLNHTKPKTTQFLLFV